MGLIAGAGGSRDSYKLKQEPAGWIVARHGQRTLPDQGWKLHVTAEPDSAEAVISCAVPVLCTHHAAFKVAGSKTMLAALNDGSGGASQIGKFITVYPADDEAAVHLAAALDEATKGLLGPRVPSDRRLTPGSLVHYRYGGFGARSMQTAIGEIVPALVTPEGELVPDRRLPFYDAPAWAADPFEAAGLFIAGVERDRLVNDRYVIVATLARSPRAEVHMALDLDEGRCCVLKGAPTGSAGAGERRLRHEAEVLERLAADSRFPTAYGLFTDGDRSVLVLEDIAGKTLSAHLAELVASGRSVAGELIASWGSELAEALQSVHDAGYVYRDLKSSNVLITPDGTLRLIDFELAHEIGSPTPVHGAGTTGYMSPQQAHGEPPAVTDDVYSLGALLYSCATLTEPGMGPLARPVALVNPSIGGALARVLERCLDPKSSARYTDAAAAGRAIAASRSKATSVPPAFGEPPLGESEDRACARSRRLAVKLLRTICDAAQPIGDGGLTWGSSNLYAMGGARDLNMGSGGTVLALAELVRVAGGSEERELLEAAARSLANAARPEGPPLGGLYVGEAGVGAALLRAGQVLGDDTLRSAAAARGRDVACLPHSSPDLFNGTAGRLRFHLLLWDDTGAAEHLGHAVAAGEHLLGVAERSAGEAWWTIPPGYGDMSGQAYLGYAHGAAGIADSLLDLHDATGDARFLEASTDTARWLERLAVPVLDDSSGRDWPSTEGGKVLGPYWCHGAAGIGRFFLHAERQDVAAQAARAAARGARRAGPIQCHGLSGNIEFLLDVHEATGDPAFMREARWLAQLLELFATERGGNLVWPSDSSLVFSPDYLTGYAGVAMCLLRLADPTLPHQLSRRGFKVA